MADTIIATPTNAPVQPIPTPAQNTIVAPAALQTPPAAIQTPQPTVAPIAQVAPAAPQQAPVATPAAAHLTIAQQPAISAVDKAYGRE